jgi:hypothetical protein
MSCKLLFGKEKKEKQLVISQYLGKKDQGVMTE